MFLRFYAGLRNHRDGTRPGENDFVLSEQKNEEVSDIVDCPEGNVFCFCGFTRDGGVIGKEINRVRNTSKKYRY